MSNTNSAPVFVATDVVAAMLGQSADHFLRIRASLEDDAGFPLPVPHWRRPLKWRRDQVEGWLAAQGRPQADMATLIASPNVIRMADYARQE